MNCRMMGLMHSLRGDSLSIWAVFLSLFVLNSMAFAESSTAKKELSAQAEKSRKVLMVVLENIHSKDNVIHLIGNAGLSIEAFNVIGSDLEKRLPKDAKIPKMVLKDDEIQIDGKATGLKLISYEPLKMKIQKRTWAFDPDKTPDVNYLDFTRFLEVKAKSNAMIRLFFPQAQAQFSDLFSGALSGTVIGALAGGVIGSITGMDTFSSMLGGGMLGMIVGGTVGANNQNSIYSAPCGRNIMGVPLACPAGYPYQYQYQYTAPLIPVAPGMVR